MALLAAAVFVATAQRLTLAPRQSVQIEMQVALPLFVLVALAPLTLIGGLYQIFSLSTWTLTYREMRALEAVKPEQLPPASA